MRERCYLPSTAVLRPFYCARQFPGPRSGPPDPLSPKPELPLMPLNQQDRKTLAEWLAALAEPTRLAVIAALAAGPKTVTELARVCKAEMVNVSHHLGVMKASGLVDSSR